MVSLSRLLVVLVLALPASMHAATWTGAVNNLWSNPGNWDVLPVAGDDLVFANSVQTNTINDITAGRVFRSINASNGPWTFSGNEIVLTHGIVSQTATFALPITLGASQEWQTTIVQTTSYTGTIDLNGNALTLFGHVMSGSGGVLNISGTIEGSGSIITKGYRVELSGNNTYSGTTEVQNSELAVSSDHALGVADGSAANGTVVIGRLRIENVSIGNEAITFGEPANGEIRAAGTVSIDGPISASSPASGTPSYWLESGASLTLNGPISGGAYIARTTGAGTQLTLTDPASSFTSLDIIGDVTVIVGGNGALPSSADIVLEGGALDMNNFTSAVHSFIIQSASPNPVFKAGSEPLDVAGLAVLAWGDLTLTDGFDGVSGTSYTILRNAGAVPTGQEFHGLPEGASFTLRGQTYVITYRGGDGNDVVLRAGPPDMPRMSIADGSVGENGGVATIDVTLTRAPASTVTVSWATIDGTATAGADYQSATGTLTFLAGETHKTITVGIADDSTPESEEMFALQLTGLTGDAVLERSEGVVTIVDDDPELVATTYEYARIGNRALLLDLTVPQQGTGPFPVIVWIHPGGWTGGVRFDGFALREAARGYAVASVDYRTSDEAVFPAQIADVKAAVRWLRAHAEELHLDSNRIGAWGVEAGAHLAALLGTAPEMFDDPAHGNAQFPSRVTAVLEWGGPTSLLTLDAGALACSTIDHDAPSSPASKLLGCALETCPEKAAGASPVSWATPGDAAFLIMHGANDCEIPSAQATELFAALRSAGLDAEVRVLPNVAGVLDVYWSSEEALVQADAFFDAKLKDADLRRRRRSVR